VALNAATLTQMLLKQALEVIGYFRDFPNRSFTMRYRRVPARNWGEMAGIGLLQGATLARTK
jgi:hypothetical protein